MTRKSLKRGIGLSLCLGVALAGSLAWAGPAKAHPGLWRHYNTTNSRLPSNNVQAIAYTQDQSVDVATPGLWIGTDAGLSYTNGHDWESYTTANSDLPGNDVRAVVHGRQPGELWIATNAGVARLDYAGTPRDKKDDTRQVFTVATDRLNSDDVLSLALDREGRVWAGTTQGLACYDGRTWRACTGSKVVAQIRDLAYDAKRHTLWVATDSGVGKLDVETETWTAVFRAHAPGSELPSDDVRALAVSADGRAWMGTAKGLAALALDSTWTTWVPGKPGLPAYPVADLCLDPTGRYLWVATDGGGASRYDVLADRWQRFNTLGSELPDDHVRAVLASHEGTVWLGTAAGLSGMEWMWETQHFLGPRVPGQLASNTIAGGWVDPGTGTVWVSTVDGGVSRSDDDGATWQTFTTAHGLGSDNVWAVWGDGAGTVWVTTSGGGASRSDDGGATWQTFTTAHGLKSNILTSVWGDGKGTVWVGTQGGGVSRSTDGGRTWQTFTTAPAATETGQGLKSHNVRAVWVASEGTVWVGTEGGLSRSDDGGATWQTFTTAHGLGADNVATVWGDGAGTVWAGAGAGLSRSDDGGQTWRTFTTAQGLETNAVLAVWGTADGTVWAGTEGGVSRSMDGGASWQTFTTAQGLGSNTVLEVWGTADGTVWAGTYGGVSRSTDGGQTWQTFPATSPGLGSDEAQSVWVDATGTCWVGTNTGGLNRSDDGGASWQTFTVTHGLGSNDVKAVWGAADGTVWAGTGGGGVSRSTDSGQTWQTFTTAHGLGSDYVTAVWGDGQGTVWTVTGGAAVSRSNDGGQTWQTFTTAHGLGSNVVLTVWVAPEGTVWVGTQGGGVSRSTDGGASWQTFTTAHGLGNDDVQDVWGDSQGTVWASTQGGVSRSDDGGTSWRTFTTAHGLSSNTVTNVWGDDKGTVWAGTWGNDVSRSTDGGASWQTFTTAQGLGDNWVSAMWGTADGTVWVGTYKGVSRLIPAAGPAPAAQWREPASLINDPTFRLLDDRTFDGQFKGLNLAPGDVRYMVVLSPTIEGRSVFSQTFTAGEIGEAGIAPVSLGDERSPLAFGDYRLSLTAENAFGSSSTIRRTVQVQARPVITQVVFYQDGAILEPVAGTPSASPSPDQSSRQVPSPSPTPEPALTPILPVSGTIVLTARPGGVLSPLTATLTITDADSPVEGITVTYAWDPGAESVWRELDGNGIVGSGLVSGSHVLAFRATDPDGNASRPLLGVSVQVIVPPAPPELFSVSWLFIGVVVTLAAVGVVVVSLRDYPVYLSQWMAAREYPLQQIIPLVAPPGERIDHQRLGQKLRAVHAFSTEEQVQDALDALVERGIMRAENGAYRFASTWTAWVHRWTQLPRIPTLAERIRAQHPLYVRAHSFFGQARFHMQELGVEEFLLVSQGPDHPQSSYGPVYARLIAGRSPTGDDFTAVFAAARRHLGDDLTHRVAMAISDRRPEPGARYRLYEIRQREGLAIVPLDSSLFDQIKPNRTASDILATEIDQATGQQNLYAISGPVSSDLSFFGRERVLQEIIDLLDAGQPVGIFGLRKVGKTSLVQRLQGQMAQRRPIAFVDTQGTVRQQGVWPLYPAIIAALAAHLRRIRPDLSLPPLQTLPEAGPPSPATSSPLWMADAFPQDLHALHQALGEPGKKERMLLIVDEIDRLLPAGTTPGYEGFAAFFGQLRAANQQARLLDFVVVGVDPTVNRRDRWDDHDNELYLALREVWMPPMAAEDVQEMIESLGSQMGVRYQARALRLLVQAGGGQPFVTRQMCSRAVANRLGKGVITVAADQARAAIEEFVFQDSYLAEMWRTRLDDTQREILRALARASDPIPRTQLLPAAQRQETLAALGALEDYTLVHHDERGYAIAWDVLRHWIRWVELGLEE